MIGDYTICYKNPPSIMYSRAKDASKALMGIMWRKMYEYAMNDDMIGLDRYAKDMINRNKPHAEAIVDLCAHFSIVCGIDIDPLGEDATEAIYFQMANFDLNETEE